MKNQNDMPENLSKAIKTNPLQAITVGIAIAGVVVSLFNFYLLSNISPVERRVAALEKTQDANLPYVGDYLVTKQKIESMSDNINDIKQDLRDIKNYLNVSLK